MSDYIQMVRAHFVTIESLADERDKLKSENETLLVKLEVSEDARQVLRGSLAQAEADIDGLRKDAERLQSATDFVKKLCDSAGKQPSVATGYLHDILSAMVKGEQP